MAPPVLVDTTRLLTRVTHAAPTGIDRIDLAYARHFLRGQDHALRGQDGFLREQDRGEAIAATPHGMRRMPEVRLAGLFDTIAARWSEEMPANGDPVLARVEAWLAAPAGSMVARQAPLKVRSRGISLAEIVRMAESLSWAPAATAARNAVYLHTSHLRLDRPELFNWLDARPDIRSVFFVHDIIPIEHPEYGVPGEAARHRIRMNTVAQRAAAVVVGSCTIRDTLEAYWRDARLRVPAIEVAAIGVEPIFAPHPADQAPGGGEASVGAARPYFIVCSTIEARKNHLLLLQIWRELAGRLGADMPALVIVGRRGWESENVIDLLERCPAMHDHVVEAAGLSTPGLVRLLRGARALLMPSFAEGYGIPVVEALALGVPVIASDLPVHREIAEGHARLAHPLDGIGWLEAILAAARGPRDRITSGFQPPRWEAHFRRVDALVGSL